MYEGSVGLRVKEARQKQVDVATIIINLDFRRSSLRVYSSIASSSHVGDDSVAGTPWEKGKGRSAEKLRWRRCAESLSQGVTAENVDQGLKQWHFASSNPFSFQPHQSCPPHLLKELPGLLASV